MSKPALHAVFISYASQDAEAAQSICEHLRVAGVEVWFDQGKLRGGDAWDAHIRRQIKECALFVPVISANTQARREGYFRREWKLATERRDDMADGTLFVVPVCLDETREEDALVPAAFLEVQWTRLTDDAALSAFGERVRELLGGRMVPAFAPMTSRHARRNDADSSRPEPDGKPPRRDCASPKSIAVLPFENLSPDPENAFFADGLTEEIIADLSKVQALRVISRTSAMHFKGTKKSVPEIAIALNVRYVLEGSVRRAGNKVRITAQLIEAASDVHLWSEKISALLEDIFDVQEQVSRRIIDALQIALTADESRRLSARPLPSTQAYDLWLRLRHEWQNFTPAGFERALRLADEATAMAGENALIHAAIGYIYYAGYDFGMSHNDATLRRAGQHASRALALDAELSLAWLAAGLEQFKRGDFSRAASLLQRAAALDRQEDALCYLTLVFAASGCDEEARSFADELAARSPFYSLAAFSRAFMHAYAGRFEEAASVCREFLARTAAEEPLTMWWLGQAEAFGGREAEGVAHLRRVVEMGAGVLGDLSELLAQALTGDAEGTRAWYDSHPVLAEMAKTDEWVPNLVASVFARIGDRDRALEFLEYGVAWGFSAHRFLAEHNRFLVPLRGHPRFAALLEKARAQEREFHGARLADPAQPVFLTAS